MASYLIIYTITTLLVYLSERELKHNRKKRAIALGIIIVLSLSIFAGLRDYTIGTDVRWYVTNNFSRAKIYLGRPIQFLDSATDGIEPFFLIITYISALIWNTVHGELFLIALLINGFVFAGIYKSSKKQSMTFSWLMYCLTFFNLSLNAMRQSMAAAVIFYAFSDTEHLTVKKAIVLGVVATLFHRSGAILFILYLIYVLFGIKIEKRKIIPKILFVLLLFSPLFMNAALRWIISHNFISAARYTWYLDQTGELALGNLFFRSIGMISLVLFVYKKKNTIKRFNQEQDTLFLIYIGLMDILLLLNNNLLTGRISTFFDIFQQRYFAQGLQVYKKGGTRWIATIILILVSLAMWFYIYVYLGNSEIIPYKLGTDLF